MQTTTQIKLILSREQKNLINMTMKQYISTVNDIVKDMVEADEILKLTSKDISFPMPSALRNQAISDSKSTYQKYKKECRKAENWNKKNPQKEAKRAKVPNLKKPVAIWNNQNYRVSDDTISFPVFIEGKTKSIKVKAIVPAEILERIKSKKLGTLRITKKKDKYIAQIAVNVEGEIPIDGQIMGVDLGLKIPAVAVTENSKTKFFGNGRKNKYIKRKHRATRKKLGKIKKPKVIKKLNNKEQRWMQDQDHKISRQLINFAKENGVSTIHLEKLSGIRQTARTSRKNEKNLHTWSFYRLAQFIEYKAYLEGIKVEYVDPKYTSQTCPVCGERNKAKDRNYKCSCGFKSHRDILGARNIISAPVISGKNLSA